MAQPVYLVYFLKYKDPWYKLTTEEQDKFLSQTAVNLKQVGGESVIICRSGWASAEWRYWGVEKYPDIEAVQKRSDILNNMNWGEYAEVKSCLGVETSPPVIMG